MKAACILPPVGPHLHGTQSARPRPPESTGKLTFPSMSANSLSNSANAASTSSLRRLLVRTTWTSLPAPSPWKSSGGWHAYGMPEADPDRLRYILDQGWTLVIVWASAKQQPIGPGACDYIAALAQQASRDPSWSGQYRVIWGDGRTRPSRVSMSMTSPEYHREVDTNALGPEISAPGRTHCWCPRGPNSSIG